MTVNRAQRIRDQAARIYGLGIVAFIAAFSAVGLAAFFYSLLD